MFLGLLFICANNPQTQSFHNETYGLTFIPFEKNNKKIEELYISIVTNAIMMKYNNNNKVLNKIQAKAKYQSLCENEFAPFCFYVVVYNRKYVGYISLYKCGDETSVSFSMFVKLSEQKNKFGTKIVASILDFYRKNKEKLNIKSVESIVHMENIPSNKIMVKNSMKLIKSNYYARGILANKYEIII